MRAKRRAWSRRSSASSATLGHIASTTLREASRVFDRDLKHDEQLRLAEEIVLTRAEELRIAYANVVDVSFGHRRVRDRRAKRHRVVPTPCVRFLVAHKWSKPDEKRRAGRVPHRLLAFCVVNGQRRLCAVPTDVEDARIHDRIRAQGTAIVATWEASAESGVIACAVGRDTVADRVYGIGCRHVLSLSARFFDQTTWGALVHVDSAASSTIVGPTRAIAGRLASGDSFDAQLVEATNAEALRQALGVPVPTSYARGVTDLPATYDIITPGGAISAAFVDFVPRPHYEVDGRDIGHRTLVHSQPVEGTNPGTSGSPVVSKDRHMLVGMHVAAWAGLDPQGHYIAVSYMIPAWELLNPANYGNASNGERWTLVTP